MHGGNSDKWGINSDYTPEYRRWVAEQVAVQGKTVPQVAHEQDLTVGLVSGWHGVYLQGLYAGVVAAPSPRLKSEPVPLHTDWRRRPRRYFPVEFKRDLIESAASRSVSLAQAAREAAIPPVQVYAWHRQYKAGKFGPPSCQPVDGRKFASSKHRACAVQEAQPITASPAPEGITVQLPGGTAVIPQGADAETVQAVIAALK